MRTLFSVNIYYYASIGLQINEDRKCVVVGLGARLLFDNVIRKEGKGYEECIND